MKGYVEEIEKETGRDPERPVLFMSSKGVYGFLSPLFGFTGFEVDGWLYPDVFTYMKGEKAKAVGKDDLWKKIIQDRDGSRRTNWVINGLDVKKDGEGVDEKEKNWAGELIPWSMVHCVSDKL